MNSKASKPLFTSNDDEEDDSSQQSSMYLAPATAYGTSASPTITHVEFLKTIIHKPIFVLQKDHANVQAGRLASFLLPKSIVHSCYISAMEEETLPDVNSQGKQDKIHRIYVTSNEPLIDPTYFNVGWVVSEEVKRCMLCHSSFSIFLHRHLCCACGNVICLSCSNQTAFIYELPNYPPLRVCNMCCFGQETIHCVPSLKRVFTVMNHDRGGNSEHTNIDAALKTPLEKLFDSIVSLNSDNPQNTMVNNSSNIISSGSQLSTANLQAHNSMAVSNNCNLSQQQQQARDSLISSDASSERSSWADHKRYMFNVYKELIHKSVEDRFKILSRYHTSNNSSQWKKIVPNVGFVIKTKNQMNKEKVFINICSHASIPFNTPSTEHNSSSNALDANDMDSGDIKPRVIFMAINPKLTTQNVKDTMPCQIYDVVVHPDELYIMAIDPSGKSRKKLCKQILQVIQDYEEIELDQDFVVLRLLANYKFANDLPAENSSITKGSSNSNKSGQQTQQSQRPRECVLPSTEAFQFFYCIYSILPGELMQLEDSIVTTTVTAYDKDNQNNEEENDGMITVRERSDSFMSVLSESDTTNTRSFSSSFSLFGGSGRSRSMSISNPHRRKSILYANDVLLPTNACDSLLFDANEIAIASHSKYGFDTREYLGGVGIRGMILPHDELDAIFNEKKFAKVMEVCELYEIPWEDLMITPSPGYVIQTQRPVKPSRNTAGGGTGGGETNNNKPLTMVYFNICHHAKVGIVSLVKEQQKQDDDMEKTSHNKAFSTTGSTTNNNTIPFILGSTKESIQTIQGISVRVLAVDIVIPSTIMNEILHGSDNMAKKEEVSIYLLQELSNMSVILDSQFSFPNISKGYVSNVGQPQHGGGTGGDSATSIQIPSVINLTESEKADFTVAFVGSFYKEGKNMCTSYWKERFFLLTESTLQYYDFHEKFQYNYNIEGAFFTCPSSKSATETTGGTTSGTHRDLHISSTHSQPDNGGVGSSGGDNEDMMDISEYNAPKNSFPFTISNKLYDTQQRYLIGCTRTLTTRNQLQSIFQVRDDFHKTIKALIAIPTRKTGYLKKQAHWKKNWKERYFVINFGELSYYEIKHRFPVLAMIQKRRSMIRNKLSRNVMEERASSATTTTSGSSAGTTTTTGGGKADFVLSQQQVLKGCVSLKNASVNIVMVRDAKTGQINRNIHQLKIVIPFDDNNINNKKNNHKKHKKTGNKNEGYEMLVECANVEELHSWFDVIQEHIDYCNEYCM